MWCMPSFPQKGDSDVRCDGNPAAVMVFDKPLDTPEDAAWVQTVVARDMNLSETAFVCPVKS